MSLFQENRLLDLQTKCPLSFGRQLVCSLVAVPLLRGLCARDLFPCVCMWDSGGEPAGVCGRDVAAGVGIQVSSAKDVCICTCGIKECGEVLERGVLTLAAAP